MPNADLQYVRRSVMFRVLNTPTSPVFTSIETMIVVAILAIIIALAYPSYVDQLRKTRRAEAVSSLMDRAQLLERCFTHFNLLRVHVLVMMKMVMTMI